MYCPHCGAEIGNAKKCKKCGWIEPRKKQNRGCLTAILVFVLLAAAVGIAANLSSSVSTLEDAYLQIDHTQATKEHCEEIAAYMDDYLEAAGYFPLGYSVEWIGYYKYAEDYEFEDWQSWGLSGYYSYSANLSTGEMANGRVQCYWGDGETPTIVNLNIETATTENPIVEYSDEAVSACFGVYTQKAEALLTQ